MNCIRINTFISRLCTYILLVLPCLFYSQKQGNFWFYGNLAGINFNNGTVLSINGGQTSTDIPAAPFTQEGSSSICDSTGAFLFYTGGRTIWNRFHQPMLNGSFLMGSTSSTQSSLIIPKPGSDSLFYVFTSDSYQSFGSTNPPHRGYRYSIVDICLDNGKGAVIPNFKNILLADSSTEKLAACKDAAGTGYWIVGHKMFSDKFIAWHLTSAGITSTITSSLGTRHGMNPFTSQWFPGYAVGQMKLNPAGTKLAVAIGNNQTSILDLFDFNNASGVVSSFCHMYMDSLLNKSIYGIEFSPDGSKLYATLSAGIGPHKICQLDMNAAGGACSAIYNSSLTVFQTGGPELRGMQVAPNGKIYFVGGSSTSLGAISAPNQLGVACNPALYSHTLTPPSLSYFTLPSFVAGYAYHNGVQSCCVAPNLSITSTKNTLCVGESATLTVTGGSSYTWNPTGVPGSTLVISPNASLEYTVSVEGQGNCKAAVKKLVNVTALPTLTVNGISTICEGSPATQTVLGASSYTWSNGLTGNPVSLTPSVTTSYTVSGSNAAGCKNQQTLTVQVNPSPTITTTGPSSLCAGSAVIYTASGAQSYTWNTGVLGSVVNLTPTTSGNYFVTGSGSNGCTAQASLSVLVKPLPVISANTPTTCESLPVQLTAFSNSGAGISYTWMPGSLTGAAITITPSVSGNYTVTADYDGCQAQKNIFVTVLPYVSAIVDFSYSAACEKSTVAVPLISNNFNSGGTYSSSDPQVTLDPQTGNVNLSTLSTGVYLINYSVAPGGCTVATSRTASITILPSPTLVTGPDQEIEEGGTAALSVMGGNAYSWFPVNNLSCNSCDAPLASPPETMEYCVTSLLNSCATTTCILVKVIDCDFISDYSVPNAFTPNGDGNNDEFCLQGWNRCISNFNILIYNRWGEKVFESQKPDFCWDGTFKGKPLPSETFTYVLKAMKIKDAMLRKGNITLIR